LSGAVASTALAIAPHDGVLSLILGAGIAAAYWGGLCLTSRSYVENFMAAVSLGVPLWGIISVIAIPLLSGEMPEWGAEQMRQQFPALVGWVMYSALLGIVSQDFTLPSISSDQSQLPKCCQFQSETELLS
jgi:hypothetical protein